MRERERDAARLQASRIKSGQQIEKIGVLHTADTFSRVLAG